MEAVVQYRQAALPKLRITEEISRRDSITSSRTGDSGYDSDLNISSSPLDLVYSDQAPLYTDRLVAPPHSLRVELDAAPISSSWTKSIPNRLYASVLLRDQVRLTQIPKVTSDPRVNCPPIAKKPVWTSNLGDPATSRKEEVENWLDESLSSNSRLKERVPSVVSLSSNGSGGDYSITDDSENEEMSEELPSSLSKAALTTIDLILRKIEVNLNYVALRQCAGGASARGHATSGTPRRGSAQGVPGKRKARGDDGLPPNDQDDDGSNKRRRVSITTTEDSENGPRFACPFFKHDPNRYRNRRTCPGPGWPTVHRMKEHLYRSHAQPIYCPRCYTMFDADSDLSNHLRSDPCQMSAPQPIEGIDRETLNTLRKRSPPLRLEEDKWRDTYRALFPDVAESDIPSPYYDGNSPTEESRRFRRELLYRIRQELFATAEREASPVEQNLLRRVSGIIQRCEGELLDSLYSPQNNSLLQPPLPNIGAPNPDISPPHGNAYPTGRRHSAQPSFHYPSQPQAPTSVPPTRAPARLPPAQLEPVLPPNSQFPVPPWEDSGDWIDWNAIFPPGSDLQASDRGDAVPAFTAPVWT